MVDNIEYLKEQISNAWIWEPAEWWISCNWDYWKILSWTYTRENAVIECLNVWSGRYLPTEEELMNLYYSSCKSNLNFIDDAFYWASTISWDSSRWWVRYMKLNVKAYNYGHNNFSSKYNVICIHD
jgi:hypothetical protein